MRVGPDRANILKLVIPALVRELSQKSFIQKILQRHSLLIQNTSASIKGHFYISKSFFLSHGEVRGMKNKAFNVSCGLRGNRPIVRRITWVKGVGKTTGIFENYKRERGRHSFMWNACCIGLTTYNEHGIWWSSITSLFQLACNFVCMWFSLYCL